MKNDFTTDCTDSGTACHGKADCQPICLHKDLKYNPCCNTVTCQKCGTMWDAEIQYTFTCYPHFS